MPKRPTVAISGFQRATINQYGITSSAWGVLAMTAVAEFNNTIIRQFNNSRFKIEALKIYCKF